MRLLLVIVLVLCLIIVVAGKKNSGKGSNKGGSDEEKSDKGSDKGGSDKGGSDKGGSDKDKSDKGSDKGGSDKGGSDKDKSDKGSDKGGSDKGGSDKDKSDKGSDKGGSDKGGSDKDKSDKGSDKGGSDKGGSDKGGSDKDKSDKGSDKGGSDKGGSDKDKSDKGSDKGGSDKGGSDKDKSDKGSDKGGSDKDKSDKGSDKGGSDKDKSDKGSDKGGSDKDKGDKGSDKGGSDKDKSDKGSDKGGSDKDKSDKGSDKGGSDKDKSDKGSDKGGSDKDKSDKGSDKGGSDKDKSDKGSGNSGSSTSSEKSGKGAKSKGRRSDLHQSAHSKSLDSYKGSKSHDSKQDISTYAQRSSSGSGISTHKSKHSYKSYRHHSKHASKHSDHHKSKKSKGKHHSKHASKHSDHHKSKKSKGKHHSKHASKHSKGSWSSDYHKSKKSKGKHHSKQTSKHSKGSWSSDYHKSKKSKGKHHSKQTSKHSKGSWSSDYHKSKKSKGKHHSKHASKHSKGSRSSSYHKSKKSKGKHHSKHASKHSKGSRSSSYHKSKKSKGKHHTKHASKHSKGSLSSDYHKSKKSKGKHHSKHASKHSKGSWSSDYHKSKKSKGKHHSKHASKHSKGSWSSDYHKSKKSKGKHHSKHTSKHSKGSLSSDYHKSKKSKGKHHSKHASKHSKGSWSSDYHKSKKSKGKHHSKHTSKHSKGSWSSDYHKTKKSKGKHSHSSKGSSKGEDCRKVTINSRRQRAGSRPTEEKQFFSKPKYVAEITSVKFIKQIGRHRCEKDVSYGMKDGLPWVSQGCSLKAEICFKRGPKAAEDEGGDDCGGECHMNAKCIKGRCKCQGGLMGNGRTKCFPACICTSTGDPHTRQYDGQMTHFQGSCRYLLSAVPDVCEGVRVEVKHEHRKNNFRVTYVKSVEVLIGSNLTVTLAPHNELLINGETVSPTYVDGQVRVTFYGKQLIATLINCDIVVSYDGWSRASVIINKEYGEDVTGMCGNCNDIEEDDYILPDGRDVSELKDRDAVWGNAWHIPDPEDPQASCAEDDIKLVCSPMNKEIAKGWCSKINDIAGPFSALLAIDWVKEEAEKAAGVCEFDVCNDLETGGNAIKTACDLTEAFNKYLEESKLGATNWRSDFCGQQCGINEVYVEELKCEKSCSDDPDKEDEDCTPAIEAGCACKEGFIRSGSECVPPEQCGCKRVKGRRTKYYQVGKSYKSSNCEKEFRCVHEDGHSHWKTYNLPGCLARKARCRAKDGELKCLCNRNLVGDGITKCEPECGTGIQCHEHAKCIRRRGKDMCRCQDPYTGDGVIECKKQCVCTASGDPHYTTFDGQKIHFQGACLYTLVNVLKDGCGMNLMAKNVPSEKRPTVSLTRMIHVIMMPSSDVITVGQGGYVLINGNAVSGSVIETEHYKIVDKGKNGLIIITNKHCDLKATYNGKHTAKAYIGPDFGPLNSGICGTCDGKKNDFRTKDGTDVSMFKDKFVRIGDSYLVPVPGEANEECRTKDVVPDCSPSEMAEFGKDQYCGLIKNPAKEFHECIGILRDKKREDLIDDFFNECLFDVCEMREDSIEMRNQVCDVLNAFMSACYDHGTSEILFRTTTFCPMTCGANMKYNPARTMTMPSCDDPRPARPAPGPVSEGCECLPKFLYDPGRKECVQKRECGCMSANEYISVGSTVVNEDCTLVSTCVRDGGGAYFEHVELEPCGSNKVCRPVDGIRECTCKPGFMLVNDICQEGGICDFTSPCLNGGTCNNDKSTLGYNCNCRFGFTGRRCEDELPRNPPKATTKPPRPPTPPNKSRPTTQRTPPVEEEETRGCPPGQSFDVILRNCKLCPEGTFKAEPGEAACQPCATGEYQNKQGQRSCSKCTSGTYQDERGQIACKLCTPGEYQNQAGQDSCIKCGTGMYQDKLGQAQCKECGLGKYQDKTGQNACHECGPGQYQNEFGQAICKQCESGEYQAMVGQSICRKCARGSYQDEPGMAECKPCQAGEYQNNNGQNNCKNCPNGYYQDKPGQRECKVCNNGHFQDNEGQTDCEKCDIGTFQDQKGQPSCKKCSAGEHQDMEGATKCRKCIPGQYQDTEGQMGCKVCAPGTYSNQRGAEVCVLCADGTYADSTGSTVCKKCSSATPYSTVSKTSCIGECQKRSPCKNGALCKNTDNGGFVCTCTKNWIGPTCEQPRPTRPPTTTPSPLATTTTPTFSEPEDEIEDEDDGLPPRPPTRPYLECLQDDDPRGVKYFGNMSTTTSGEKCQHWVDLSPHSHAYSKKFKKDQNFCRNRAHGKHGLDGGPWCYTTNPDIEWEYCQNIKRCSKPDEVIPPPPADKGCYHRDDSGKTYSGPVAYTMSGKWCGLWKDNGYDIDGNMCMNPTPDARPSPWCFTDEGDKSCVEYCRVPICDSPAPPDDMPCVIKEKASTCESVITIEGKCYYHFGFGDDCDFTVVQENRQEFSVYLNGIDDNGPVHELHWKAIGGPKSFTDQRCGTKFEVDSFNKITVRKPICALCAKKTFESFMNDITKGTKSCEAR